MFGPSEAGCSPLTHPCRDIGIVVIGDTTNSFSKVDLTVNSTPEGRAAEGGTPEGRAVSVTRELDLSLLCRI